MDINKKSTKLKKNICLTYCNPLKVLGTLAFSYIQGYLTILLSFCNALNQILTF